MSTEQVDQPLAPSAEDVARALDALHLTVNFHKPFFNTKEAAIYTGRTLRAFYEFARRHHIPREGDGTIARRHLDRIKRQAWTTKRGAKRRPSSENRTARS